MMAAFQNKPRVLYSGLLKQSDIYRDINQGFCHFYSVDYIERVKNSEDFDFLLCLSPHDYYRLPIVEVVSYFLTKRWNKNLDPMFLTALHEAISNSLLWGLLKIERPDDFLSLGKIIDKKIERLSNSGKTLQIGASFDKTIKFFLINSSDDSFDIESIGSANSPYYRGTEIIKSFSDIEYDAKSHTLTLKCEENHLVQQAAS